MKYIHELACWPTFTWDQNAVAAAVGSVRHRQGRLVGRMEALGFALRSEAILETLTLDVVKSSEIEGQFLDVAQVRSSIARKLGMDIGGLVPSDRNVDGVVEMMLDATQKFAAPLTKHRLCGWHASLFPAGRSGIHTITVGDWRMDRDGPMRVVSGPIGHERVHYEAPAASRLTNEMKKFLNWFNHAAPSSAKSSPSAVDPVINAGIAHLWFVTLHPFDDGNGRIARAIADMQLARADGTPDRFYSMSVQIRQERNAYYDILEKTQKNTSSAKAGITITAWLIWFVHCLERALDGTEFTLSKVLIKSRFWEAHSSKPLNERQRSMLNRLLDGFEGKMTSTKWAKIATCSQDTALRDIIDLIDKGMLKKDTAGGRSTHYLLRE